MSQTFLFRRPRLLDIQGEAEKLSVEEKFPINSDL